MHKVATGQPAGPALAGHRNWVLAAAKTLAANWGLCDNTDDPGIADIGREIKAHHCQDDSAGLRTPWAESKVGAVSEA